MEYAFGGFVQERAPSTVTPDSAPNPLFRAAASERLASPEQLDRALEAAPARAWIAVGTLMLVVVGVLAWSIVGRVSTWVTAQGIFLHRGGRVVDAVAPGGGTLTRILVGTGETVEEGEVIAEAVNPEILERHRSALALVDERLSALRQLEAATTEENALEEANLVRRRENLDRLEAANRDTLATVEERLGNHQELLADGIITRSTVEQTQQELDRARRELFAVLRERDDLEAGEVRRRNERQVRLAESRARLTSAERQVQELETRLDTQRIAAPVAGSVTELKAQPGALLATGQPVLSIRTGADRLEVLAYVPSADGSRVQAGMEALVSPASVRREEYGSIRGEVESISAFPATVEGMVAILQNRDLAQAFMEAGPPYASRVTLAPDEGTVSGVAWTSPRAASQMIASGALASIEVRVESQPPIALAIPLLRELLGL